MIVEMIGTPGAGKTSLLPAVIETLQSQGQSARTVVDAARPFALRTSLGSVVGHSVPLKLQPALLWQVFYWRSFLARFKFANRHQDLLAHIRETQKQQRIPYADKRHASFWFNHLTGYYEFLGSQLQPGEALVMDEGFVHRVVQFFASGREAPDRKRLERYVDLVPRPDLLISPRASCELCEERVYRRGIWTRLKSRPKEEISQYIANAQTVVDWTLEHVRSKHWNVIEVDNPDAGLATAQAAVRRELTTFLKRGNIGFRSPVFAYS